MQQRVVNPVRHEAEAEVTPGSVHEIRLLLQRREGSPGEGLSVSEVPLRYLDRQGRPVDPRSACDLHPIPHLDPLRVETLRAGALDDEMVAAGLASRFVVAPPDCRRIVAGPIPDGAELVRFEIHPLHVMWSGPEAAKVRDQVEGIVRLRRGVLERRAGGPSASEALDLVAVPLAQVEALALRFQPKGDWHAVLPTMDGKGDAAEFDLRMGRLRQGVERRLVVGFTGSPRGHERLSGMAEVFWLREDRFEQQLSALRPDVVIIESAAESGASSVLGQWELAFSGLDGTLPALGRRLIEAARAGGIPVHLWVTPVVNSTAAWRGCAEAVNRVVIEGFEGEVPGMPADALRVPSATCLTANFLAIPKPRDVDLVLVPTGSDLFQFPDFGKLVASLPPEEVLVTELRYRFASNALVLRLRNDRMVLFPEPSRAQERKLFRSAGLVLIPAQSLRSPAALAEIAMDAVAAGSIPVLYGRPAEGTGLLAKLDHVLNAVELMELQNLYRVDWLRERRWRGLYRHVAQHHGWRSAERSALLGLDPFPADHDHPLISAVLVTRRPHLLEQCLAAFRSQTWPNKELILVYNMDELPSPMPSLRENERIFSLPTSTNIGECLNYGIRHARGRYWAKFDDDDYYSKTYLEETEFFFRAAQADVVGRQANFIHFAGRNETSTRGQTGDRRFRMLKDGAIAGSTLAARNTGDVPLFSFKDRNCADSNWVARVVGEKKRVFSGDGTSMVVYRDADESQHTWHLSNFDNVVNRLAICSAGNLFERFESEA